VDEDRMATDIGEVRPISPLHEEPR
jgi:hypothetical protein